MGACEQPRRMQKPFLARVLWGRVSCPNSDEKYRPAFGEFDLIFSNGSRLEQINQSSTQQAMLVVVHEHSRYRNS
jgi:hypothetical protein